MDRAILLFSYLEIKCIEVLYLSIVLPFFVLYFFYNKFFSKFLLIDIGFKTKLLKFLSFWFYFHFFTAHMDPEHFSCQFPKMYDQPCREKSCKQVKSFYFTVKSFRLDRGPGRYTSIGIDRAAARPMDEKFWIFAVLKEEVSNLENHVTIRHYNPGNFCATVN